MSEVNDLHVVPLILPAELELGPASGSWLSSLLAWRQIAGLAMWLSGRVLASYVLRPCVLSMATHTKFLLNPTSLLFIL